jgi:hypothetical protein
MPMCRQERVKNGRTDCFQLNIAYFNYCIKKKPYCKVKNFTAHAAAAPEPQFGLKTVLFRYLEKKGFKKSIMLVKYPLKEQIGFFSPVSPSIPVIKKNRNRADTLSISARTL